jgi:methylphosphotriester-DNA--protein-cysteine methyltransferase
MAPGCTIKGKFVLRAKITGHRGIYHMEGCRSYQRTKSPDRWFCSEADAQAAGFRRALCTRIAKTANWVGQICRASLHRFERTISVEGGADAALADKLIEIAGKCPVHRTLEAGAAAVTKVAG